MSVNCKHFLSIEFNMQFGAQKNHLNEKVRHIKGQYQIKKIYSTIYVKGIGLQTSIEALEE